MFVIEVRDHEPLFAGSVGTIGRNG